MDYIQLLFSFFNAPLFATFIIALFWKRATPWAGVSGLVAGTLGAAVAHYAHTWGWIDLGTDQAAAFWGAAVAFIADAVVTVGVSLVTQPKPVEQLRGLVWSETPKEMRSPKREGAEAAWFRSPAILGGAVLVMLRRSSTSPSARKEDTMATTERDDSTGSTTSSSTRRRPPRSTTARRATCSTCGRSSAALFTLYGLMLTVYGIVDSQAQVDKAAGVRINLWTGLGMLALGLVFLPWVKLRPLTTEEIIEAQKEDPEEEEMAEELRVKREEAGAAPARPE